MLIKIAHRGAKGYEPENTLSSFYKALELNADAIELDVHLCKTKELVVIHDDSVDRTTNGKGYVREKTLHELKLLDTGKGEGVPTLKEVVDLINRKALLNIELKCSNTAKPVCELIKDYVNNKNYQYKDFLVSSFNHNELIEFRKLNPYINIGVLFEGDPKYYPDIAKKVNAYSINIDKDFVTKELVTDIRKRNLKVFIYTANEEAEIEKIKALEVDGIFSDFPDRLQTVLV